MRRHLLAGFLRTLLLCTPIRLSVGRQAAAQLGSPPAWPSLTLQCFPASPSARAMSRALAGHAIESSQSSTSVGSHRTADVYGYGDGVLAGDRTTGADTRSVSFFCADLVGTSSHQRIVTVHTGVVVN